MSTKSPLEATASFPAPIELRSLVERTVAALALVALSPVLIGIGCAIVIASRRSPLVAHRRAGYRGNSLWMLKFRSMWGGESFAGNFYWIERLPQTNVPADKSAADPRVSHILGRILRRTSLDELPQLVHVVCGEMSFVGPRPITAEELATHYGAVASIVLSIKPGMSGLWQVMGRDRLTYAQRRRLDVFWVHHASPKLAMWIAVRTVAVLLSSADAH